MLARMDVLEKENARLKRECEGALDNMKLMRKAFDDERRDRMRLEIIARELAAPTRYRGDVYYSDLAKKLSRRGLSVERVAAVRDRPIRRWLASLLGYGNLD